MQYSQEHLKTVVYAKFRGQTECIMGNWKIENSLCTCLILRYSTVVERKVAKTFPKLVVIKAKGNFNKCLRERG